MEAVITTGPGPTFEVLEVGDDLASTYGREQTELVGVACHALLQEVLGGDMTDADKVGALLTAMSTRETHFTALMTHAQSGSVISLELCPALPGAFKRP